MLQDSGFRYEVSIKKRLGIVCGSDADSALDVDYYTKTKYRNVHVECML